jgi:hypothetical protein
MGFEYDQETKGRAVRMFWLRGARSEVGARTAWRRASPLAWPQRVCVVGRVGFELAVSAGTHPDRLSFVRRLRAAGRSACARRGLLRPRGTL